MPLTRLTIYKRTILWSIRRDDFMDMHRLLINKIVRDDWSQEVKEAIPAVFDRNNVHVVPQSLRSILLLFAWREGQKELAEWLGDVKGEHLIHSWTEEDTVTKMADPPSAATNRRDPQSVDVLSASMAFKTMQINQPGEAKEEAKERHTRAGPSVANQRANTAKQRLPDLRERDEAITERLASSTHEPPAILNNLRDDALNDKRKASAIENDPPFKRAKLIFNGEVNNDIAL